MRWKAFFFLNPNSDTQTKETYGFNSKRLPPHVKELDEFEDCMRDMIQRIKFKTNHHLNDLQNKLSADLKEIREEKHIFVKVDKTTNYYKTEPEDYKNNPTCRLLNPSKSEIGIVSKTILDGINIKIIQATKVNIWRSTNNAIEWFKTIPDKQKHAFITFDVCDFYPSSISEELLAKALDYASKFTTITQEDREIIIHTKRSLLYHQNSPWTKKTVTECLT